ncbi:23S rRNA (guanosine(2251)-2'-O)-methyltransferase RlmB [Dissulfurispira thermophila]|uniref:23S rRNA (Guanosine(2251)-2'-O)-methyltransferase RlmB n=2 Tax=root TaxID=1 RepID=A0A7G1H055_9BACT|nr:23S rRNA (guanosine(2251)-2'-O)-methyltransferase RlmB [Dissulfurispira thermophila]BCB95682.1 23S rRNA (guanosine(2251)-2'-O)-methyltransferase RlmB [Dissulfurispira thermophila]
MKAEWLYGFNPVLEAIRSGRKIKTIYISKQRHEHIEKIIEIAKVEGICVEFAEKDFFDVRFHKGHQGIAATVEKKRLLSIEEILSIPEEKGEAPFFLVLDLIEDPRNLGAILRIADAVGIHGVIFQSHRSAKITSTVCKASSGAIEYVNIAEVVNIKHAIDKMKKLDITIIGAEAGSGLTYWDIDLKTSLALVIGSEGHGLRKTVRDACDFVVSLPMRGKVNSLNVSVATGIFAYEVIRQRSLKE